MCILEKNTPNISYIYSLVNILFITVKQNETTKKLSLNSNADFMIAFNF